MRGAGTAVLELLLAGTLPDGQIFCASSPASWAFSTTIYSAGGRSQPCLSRTFQTPMPHYCSGTLG
jgi:hypothetical protein